MIARSAAYRPGAPSALQPLADGSSSFPPAFARPRTIDLPPRGRILIVADEVPVALDLQRVLRDAGYRIIGPASRQSEVARLVRCGLLDAALVDADAREAAPFVSAEWLAAEDVPFALLVGETTSIPQDYVHRPTITKPWRAATLLDTVDKLTARAAGSVVTPPSQWPRHLPSL
jgi:hypothetical protein